MKIIKMPVLLMSIPITFFVVLIMLPGFSQAESTDDAVISIIIDDLGYKHKQDFRAINLPAPIICAIMPHAPLSERLATEAHRSGKEIILHVPMEARHKHHHLGPGGLKVAMTKHEFITTLRTNLNSMPLAIGMNNHMGSLLTSHPLHMHWLMDELKSQGYAYVDSMTTNQSVANVVARNKKVPYLVRDVFLDHEVSTYQIQQQLKLLLSKAKHKGYAIAIGHPYPETLNAVETFIDEQENNNVKIVSLKEMLNHKKYNTKAFRTTSLPKETSTIIN